MGVLCKEGIKRHWVVENGDFFSAFYPRDAMLARVFATATCLSVCPSVCPLHAGIVPA